MTLQQDEVVPLLTFFITWYLFRLDSGSSRDARPPPPPGQGSSLSSGQWYWTLLRRIAPEPAIFGIAWSVLYGLVAAAHFLAWRAPAVDDVSYTWLMALLLANLLLNKAWTPLFFGSRQPVAALVVLVATLATAVAALVLLIWQAARVSRHVPRHGDAALAAALFSPYVAWLVFALYLNARFVTAMPPRQQR